MSGQSSRIISMRYPRSSTRRFNGRTIVPGIMESVPPRAAHRARAAGMTRLHPQAVQKGSGRIPRVERRMRSQYPSDLREVLLVEDGSHDETPTIGQRMASVLAKMRYLSG